MKFIPLSNGMRALVDDQDFDFLSSFIWRAKRHRKTWYAITTVYDPERYRQTQQHGAVSIAMHQMVLIGAPLLDHRDLNGLNNTFENLRAATATQNRANAPKRNDNTSGFKGVTWHKKARKWRAAIACEHRRYSLGLFICPKAAARAYDKAARKLFGEYARVNFVT